MQNEIDADIILKPELAFEWIKYKKSPSGKKISADALAQFVSEKKLQFKQQQQQQGIATTREQEKNIVAPIKGTEPEKVQVLQFKKEDFKNDVKKERIALWCEVIFVQKEITMEDLSKAINIPDLMELEEFLFRHPPLKFAYSWRGKNLKFSDETIEKLQEILKE